jgi:hypothetical protein
VNAAPALGGEHSHKYNRPLALTRERRLHLHLPVTPRRISWPVRVKARSFGFAWRCVIVRRPPLAVRVLVVDDYAGAAESTATLLQLRFGCLTQFARDGATALARAASFRPDLVLLDVGLPGVSGTEVARARRGETASAHHRPDRLA